MGTGSSKTLGLIHIRLLAEYGIGACTVRRILRIYTKAALSDRQFGKYWEIGEIYPHTTYSVIAARTQNIDATFRDASGALFTKPKYSQKISIDSHIIPCTFQLTG